MTEPMQLVAEMLFALTNYPEMVSIDDLANHIVKVRVGGRKKKPPEMVARISREIALALKKPPAERRLKIFIVCVRTPAIERAGSPILAPGEVR